MSSLIKRMEDEINSILYFKSSAFIRKISIDISKIKPCTDDFRTLEFLLSNRKKIMKNRKLIELLGE